MRGWLTCALIGLASAGQAECPTPESAATGLRLVFDDGLVEIHQVSEDGTVSVEGRDGDVLTHRLELLRGVYLQRYVELQDGEDVAQTQITYIYPAGDAAPPEPVVGEGWTGDVVIDTVGGQEVEPQQHSVGLPQEVVIGDCTLTAVPVTISYGAETAYLEVVHFLPDYGIGYLQGYQNAGRDMNELTVTLIEALE